MDKERWEWGSTIEFLNVLDERGIAPNVGTLVGHGTVRYNVMGMQDAKANDEEIEEMADLVTESLEQGAVGLSTGLIYPPQMYSNAEELRKLTSRLATFGRPLISHIRSQGREIWGAMDELYDLCVENDIPAQHTHIQISGSNHGGKGERVRHAIDATRDRGGDLSANQHPYRAGSTRLLSLLPPRFQSLDTDEIGHRLKDESEREEIRRDIVEWRIEGWENLGGLTGWDDIRLASVSTEKNKELEGLSLEEIAAERGVRPVDVLCDVLLEEDFRVDVLLHKLSKPDVRSFLTDERISICSDGLFGDHPHPRTYGTFPRILREYVREENLLSLEEAVRKMTSLPARQFGLDDRGLVRPGMSADLVVFDPATVADQATYDDPRQTPIGIPHVLVNGEFVVRDQDTTGRTPGHVIRQ